VTRLLGSRVLRLAIAVGLTAYLLWRNDPAAIVRAAVGANVGWLALACALVVFDRAFMAWRWLALLRPVMSASPPVGAVLRVFFISSFVGSFLPASVGSDAVRAYSLRDHAVPGSAAVASVVMDRALGVVAILLVGLVSVVALTVPAPLGVYVVLLAGGAASLALAAVIFIDPVGDLVGRMMGRLPGAPVRAIAARLLVAVRTYRHHHAALAGVLAASLAVQALRVLQAWGLGRAMGIEAGLAVYFVAIPVVLLIMLLPITINGLGTGQAAFLWTFGAAGVGKPEALALSILFIALGILGNLPGGALYAMGGRRPA
jgi:glycosyltransferase 2 family protein